MIVPPPAVVEVVGVGVVVVDGEEEDSVDEAEAEENTEEAEEKAEEAEDWTEDAVEAGVEEVGDEVIVVVPEVGPPKTPMGPVSVVVAEAADAVAEE